jgi:hypothetical protein
MPPKRRRREEAPASDSAAASASDGEDAELAAANVEVNYISSDAVYRQLYDKDILETMAAEVDSMKEASAAPAAAAAAAAAAVPEEPLFATAERWTTAAAASLTHAAVSSSSSAAASSIATIATIFLLLARQCTLLPGNSARTRILFYTAFAAALDGSPGSATDLLTDKLRFLRSAEAPNHDMMIANLRKVKIFQSYEKVGLTATDLARVRTKATPEMAAAAAVEAIINETLAKAK